MESSEYKELFTLDDSSFRHDMFEWPLAEKAFLGLYDFKVEWVWTSLGIVNLSRECIDSFHLWHDTS